MVRAITYLCFFLVIWISIGYNHAATRVYYQFTILQNSKIRNETDTLCNKTQVETEEVITGLRTSDFQSSNNESDSSGKTDFLEHAEFTHDENGYHVTYNVSFDTRLGSTTLKILTG
ncbi:uncharacterized protein LOC117790431 [Drosophila innubila]|uniref:uncharacterized protein LOC117790431 n=1 Tax=Drosophila innubila TaxID=198719 RepID=UPI00148C22FC|nr:uncharacterized protein LOC117790431 [Drosophila innubila]